MHPPQEALRPRRPARWSVVPGTVGQVMTSAAILTVAALAGAMRRRAARRGDAGDVPGWVLVTLMTAGLVTALWVLARDRLVEVFNRAITSVTG